MCIDAPSLARVLNYCILAPLHILPCAHSSLHSAYVRLARSVLNYWILAPLHILPYTHSSLHIHRYTLFRVRSHRCALTRFARSGSELLGHSSVTHSALYTFIVI